MYPQNALTDASDVISFLIPNSEDFSDVNASFLSIKAKIVAANGTDLTNAQTQTAGYALLNLAGASLWKSIQVYLCDTLISDSFNTYPYLGKEKVYDDGG